MVLLAGAAGALRLPETKAPRPGVWPSDLGFGAADAQGDVFGLGLGEYVGQGAQAQAWSLRDGQAEKSASLGPLPTLTPGVGRAGKFPAAG
jgi:hypothetical protein